MSGTFTDQGLISEQTAGLVIAQRTVIRIQSDDRHEIDLYFTPPGRAEMLIDHSIIHADAAMRTRHITLTRRTETDSWCGRLS